VQLHVPGVQFGEVEQLVDQTEQALAALVDALEILGELRVAGRVCARFYARVRRNR
jgi:hypothetical protein